MAGPGLATTNDATYADSGTDASQKIHQQDHDKIASTINPLDVANTATSGHVPIGDGTSLKTRALLSTDIPTVEKNTQTGTAYTAVAGDAGKVIEMNNAAANVVTLPSLPVGTVIGIHQYGAGATSFAASGTTIRSRGGLLTLAGQYADAVARYRTTTEIVLSGDLA